MKNSFIFGLIIFLFLPGRLFGFYAEEEKKDSLLAKVYLNNADSLHKLNAYDSAAYYYNKAASAYKELNDWENICHCKIWESYMYIDMGEYLKAIENMDEAIQYFNLNLPVNNIYSYNCSVKKAGAYSQQSAFFESINILNIATQLFLTNPKCKTTFGAKKLASAYFEYGNIYLQIGKLDSAGIMYNKTLQLREENYEPNHELIIDCYNNLGVYYSYCGDYLMAINYMEKALRSREAKYGFAHPLTAWSYTNIGIVNLYTENYDTSLEYYLKGLESRKKCLPDGHIDFGSSYSVIANVYNETGDYEKALRYHNLALDIYRNVFGDTSLYVSEIHNNIADNYNKQKDYEKALEYFYKAYSIIKIISSEGVLPEQILCEFNIADSYQAQNNLDSALVYNSYSLQTNYAPVYKSGNITDVLNNYYAFLSLEQKASIYLSLYKLDNKKEYLTAANNAYMQYIELLDYMLFRISEVDSKLLLSQLNNGIMNNAINTIYALNKIDPHSFPDDRIGYLIEKNKASVLQEMLVKANINSDINIPDSLSLQWKEISGSLIALKTEKLQMGEKGSDEEKLAMDEKILSLKQELYNLNENFLETFPGFEEKISDSLFSYSHTVLENDSLTAILDYYISDSLLYVLYIDSEEITIRTTAIDSSLEQDVKDYLKCIKKNRISNFGNLSAQLYEYLIQPVADLIEKKKCLVIIPDKYLYYLPFETLCSKDSDLEFNAKNYLIREFEILYHYSASIYCNYRLNKNANSPEDISFVGFAPVFDVDSMSVAISPQSLQSFADTTFQESKEFQRSVSIDGKTYNSLPYSRMEVSTITKLFKDKNYTATQYLFRSANETVFKDVCPNFKIIHLASHGFINENNPELSGIVFSSEFNQTNSDTIGMRSGLDSLHRINFSDSNILLVTEMYKLKLNADLVVLSACETGLGSIIKGEGVMSMARGLIFAGTSNTLFSLWKVGDKNTYQLMVDFYGGVLNGETYSAALRKAKLNLIEKEETAFPKFWSSFLLLGVN